jgi:hypothetical protein
MNGQAIFEVAVNAGGDTGDVRVIDASQSLATWERVASQMTTAIRARRVAFPRLKGRTMVRFEVSSRWVLPSGSTPGNVVSRPSVELHPLEVSGCFGMRTPVRTGANFDLSDIGARPLRVVHAHILSETPM